MKLLVVGGGGREHALAAKLRADAPEARVFAAPGNPGTEAVGTNVPVADGAVTELADFADREGIDLTVVGPEAPHAVGGVDVFEGRSLPIFGPTSDGARIEASKAFADRLMEEHGIPTARFRVFREADAARAHLAEHGPPVVVKASGLAAGKGSYVCRSAEEAERAVEEVMEQRRFGEAGDELVVEEFLRGRELSVFFLADGEDAVPLLPSRDHKRLREGGEGPNTGGMGAYAPVADGTPALIEEVRTTIAVPTLEALAARGTPYRGFLYAGLMLTEEGPKVVEFNCRLGDPEAQVVLPLMTSSLLEPMAAVAHGEGLGGWSPEFADRSALITVLASRGYPADYRTGFPIEIPPELEGPDLRVYHAGTARRDSGLVTAGGRVLGVVGLGDDLRRAAERSRRGADAIRFEGKQWRRDIGRAEGSA